MKNLIQKACGMPVIGGVVTLLIGIILPIIPFILLSKSIGISNEISMVFAGLAVAGWNYYLKKSNTINVVTPVIPIPVWILGIIIAAVSLGYVITGKQFS